MNFGRSPLGVRVVVKIPRDPARISPMTTSSRETLMSGHRVVLAFGITIDPLINNLYRPERTSAGGESKRYVFSVFLNTSHKITNANTIRAAPPIELVVSCLNSPRIISLLALRVC
jgi:hypothetical protein